MAQLRFTSHLKQFFPALREGPIAGSTVSEVLHNLEAAWPGLGAYVCDDRGALRQHVNIFVDGSMVTDRRTLSDRVTTDSEVFIIQALSGG